MYRDRIVKPLTEREVGYHSDLIALDLKLDELSDRVAALTAERDALARLFLYRPSSRPGKIQLRSATLTEVMGEWDTEADAINAAVEWAKRQGEGR